MPTELPFKERLKRIVHAYATGRPTDDLMPRNVIRLRSWLPATLEEAWKEAWPAFGAMTGIVNETVGVGRFVEILVDAYLKEWAAQARDERQRRRRRVTVAPTPGRQ